MDADLQQMSREQLVDEVKKLRNGIRAHRDSKLHELCWHHPALWGLLPEKTDPIPVVPDWPEFMQGCVKYRHSLDTQAPEAPRSTELVVNIDVDDLEKAIQFYATALGLRLSRRLFENSVAEMDGATSTIQLLLKPSGSPAARSAAARRKYGRHWTPVHLDFVVKDISAAVHRAVGAGATLEGPVQSFSWGRLATMSDPFGHGYCLLQFSGGGYDAC